MSIHENIRSQRKRRHLTQEGLAEAMGVSCAAVSKWENGQSAPDLGTLAALADFFEVSVDTMLDHQVKADRLESLLSQAEQAADDNDGEKVGQLCDKLLRNYPNSPEVVEKCSRVLYQMYIQTGEKHWMEASIRETKRMFTLKKGEPEPERLGRVRYLANQYELLGDQEKAKEYYEKSAVNGDTDGDIAHCLMRMEKYAEALELVSGAAMGHWNKLYQDICVLAECWKALGKPDIACQALGWFQKAQEDLEYNPITSPILLTKMAEMQDAMGDKAGTAETYRTLLALPDEAGEEWKPAPFLEKAKPKKALITAGGLEMLRKAARESLEFLEKDACHSEKA